MSGQQAMPTVPLVDTGNGVHIDGCCSEVKPPPDGSEHRSGGVMDADCVVCRLAWRSGGYIEPAHKPGRPA